MGSDAWAIWTICYFGCVFLQNQKSNNVNLQDFFTGHTQQLARIELLSSLQS